MKHFLRSTFIVFTLLSILACTEDDTPKGETADNPNTIADFVAANSEYSLLGEAIEIAGLAISLDGTTNFTVFAPNNSAFEVFLQQNEYESLTVVPKDTLTNLLLNHVLNDVVPATDLSGYKNSLATFQDEEITLSALQSATTTINGNVTVVTSDIMASNGLIHAVDSVIAIPSLLTYIQSNVRFSILNEALQAASDEKFNYNNFFSRKSGTPITLFAPNNAAFTELLNELGVSSVSDIEFNSLRRLLDHNIFNALNVQTADLTEGQILENFRGKEITVSLGQGIQLFDTTGVPTNVLTSNLQSGNGVMHETDRILLPKDVIDTIDPTIFGAIEQDPSLSILRRGLIVTGLDEVLKDRTLEYTVFAPSNTIFNKYLQGEDIDDIPSEELTQLLLNHVITGSFLEGDFTTGYLPTNATYTETEELLDLYVSVDGNLSFNGTVNIETADLVVANGVLHKVGDIVFPATVATFMEVDPNFQTLNEGLTRADQPNYIELLRTPNTTGNAPFTFFAPSNVAFEALFVELGITDLSGIDGTTLTATLNTHIAPQVNLIEADFVDGTLDTLGDTIALSASNSTLTDLNNRVATITITNLQTANGVIHILDKVLLPL